MPVKFSARLIYFNVDNIHEATKTLGERGVAFREQPTFVADMGTYDLWMSFFSDSENNMLALRSEVPK